MFILGLLFALPTSVPKDPSILTVNIAHAAELDLSSTTTIAAYIRAQAEGMDIDPSLALYVASGESQLIATSTGDRNIICPQGPYAGQPVWARGIFQLTRCYHPNITDAQAYDPKFNIDFALPYLKDKKTCMGEFTKCREWYQR